MASPRQPARYSDWIGTDLIVFIGSNVANNQPVTTKYLHQAKKAGTRVAVLNPFREPGMEHYWIPSKAESALFGTKIADDFYSLNIGGDVAYLTGVLRHLIERGWVDEEFVAAHTDGFAELRDAVLGSQWEELELAAGASREDMLGLARLIGGAKRGILVWSMGVTQHAGGEDGVRAIVNLALARGWVGSPGCGLMPIRGHSGVQGGAEMGCYSTALPGGVPVDSDNARRFSELWGFEVPVDPGLKAPEMLDAAHRGELDVLFSSGGNFLDVLPDPKHVREALERTPLRIHMDIVLSSQMLAEPSQTVLVLPAATRYEIPGGVTETSTERRVILSPEIPGPRIAEARAEWQVLLDLASRVRPELAEALEVRGTPELRAEIAEAVPLYGPIAELREGGDSFQYGGGHYPDATNFPTENGRAHFALVKPPAPSERNGDGSLLLSTRRGKQFNSMVQKSKDSITGATREAVMIAAADAERLGVAAGQEVMLRSAVGELRCRVHVAPIAPGNAQVHWPEGNVLIAGEVRSAEAGIPDYNTRVTIEAV